MDESQDNLAHDLLRLDDLDGASRIAEEEIERVSDQGTGLPLWHLRFVRAEILRLRGRPEEALTYLERLESSNPPEAQDVEGQASLRMHRGYHLGLMARYRAAHPLLAEAEAMALASELAELRAEVWLRQAMIFFLEKDYVNSDRIYRSVLSLSEQLDGWYLRAMSLWGIGKNLMIQKQHEEATPWLCQSLRILERVGAQLSIATVWGELAVCKLGLGRDTEALELFQKSAEIDYQLGAVHNYQVALANIGNVYLHRRDFFTALSYYQKALGLARKIKDPVSVKKWTYNIRLAYIGIRAEVDAAHPKTISSLRHS